MIKKILFVAYLAILIFFVSSCNDNPSNPQTGENDPPQLNLQNEIRALPNESVSISPNIYSPSNNLSYEWVLIEKPELSEMDEKLGDSSILNLTLDVPGKYLIELIVSDGELEAKDNINLIVQYPLGSEINEETTLSDQFEYRITEALTINEPLIIESGTEIYIDSVDYNANNEVIYIRTDYRGYISANGTKDKPITFKGVNNTPWAGITLSDNDHTNSFFNVKIEDGITYNTIGNPNVIMGYLPRAILDVRGGQLILDNVEINKSKEIENIPVHLPIISARISDNVEIKQFKQNIFNSDIIVRTDHLPLIENELDLDGTIGFWGTSESIILKNVGNPYKYLDSDGWWSSSSLSSFGLLELEKNVSLEMSSISLNSHAKLIMQEGSSLIFNGGFFDIRGKIIANGTSSNPISIISNEKENGSWHGMRIYSIDNKLDYAQIKYAGAIPNDSNLERANIALYEGGSLNIQNSAITESSGWCIWVSSESELIELNNEFENCDLGNVGHE